MQRSLPLLLAALVLPSLAVAAPVWSSNFENGTTGDWSKVQSVSNDRVQVVSNPVREGQKALQVTVKQGDDPIRSGNDRAELVYMSLEPKGSEYWYRWSVMFPADYPSHPKWQLFTQWHQEGLAGTPPFEMYVVGEEMRLRTGGHEGPLLWTAPLARGQWHDFVLRVKWSDSDDGFVEMYHNGKVALPKTAAATQLPGQLNYLKMGLYRSREISQTASIYFDDVRMGTQMSDVLTPTEPTPTEPPPTEPEPTEPAPTEPTTPPEGSTPPTLPPDGWTSGNVVVQPQPDPEGPSEGEVTPDDINAGTMAAGCSTGGGMLPVAAALGLLALTSVLVRRRATVPLPVRAQRRRRR